MFDKIRDQLFGQKSEEKLHSPADQSLDEQKLVSFVREKIDEARMSSGRIANESTWMTNIAYLLGYDNVYYDAQTRQYRTPGNRGLARNRLHSNKILPTVQNRLARLCKSPPKYDIRPESNDQDDKDAARLGLDVLDVIWASQRVNEKRIQLLMWVQQCGYAYLHPCWDESLGQMMFDPETNEPVDFEGDVRVDVVSAFEVFTDPLAKTLDECQWVVRTKVRKLDYFRDRYEKGYLVKEESAWLLSTQYEQRINSMTRQGQQGDGSQVQMKNSAIECIYYEKRSKKHPKGRMVTMANGVLLEDKELPFGEIPYVKFDDVVIGGKFASEAIVTHLRPLQDYKNLLLRKRSQWVARMLAGKYLAAKGHGLTQEALNDQSGEVVEYDPVPNAGAPQPMDIPNIPSYVYQEDDRVDSEMGTVAGLGEISQGNLPSAGMPALGMQILQEQDDTRLGIVTEQHEHSYAKLGQMILKLVGMNYKTPRMLKVAGEGLDYAVKTFTGKMLRGNYDVIVIRGSTIPGSKVLNRQEILNFYDRGLLGTPGDPKLRDKMLDMLEFGDTSEIFEDHAIDMAQVKQQIDQIMNEEIPQFSELDNHELHIMEKNRFRKTDKFKTLSPVSQQILIEDIEKHISAIVNLTQPQIMQNQEMTAEMANAAQNTTTDQIEEKQGLEELAGVSPEQDPMMAQGAPEAGAA